MTIIRGENTASVDRVGCQAKVKHPNPMLHKPRDGVVLKALILLVAVVWLWPILTRRVPLSLVANVTIPSTDLANDNRHVTPRVPKVVLVQLAKVVWETICAATALPLTTPGPIVEVWLVGVDTRAVHVRAVDEL